MFEKLSNSIMGICKCFLCLVIVTMLFSVPAFTVDCYSGRDHLTDKSEQDQPAPSLIVSNNNENNKHENELITQVVMQFLGAFLGFVAAMALNRRIEKKEYSTLNKSLDQELRNIYKDLKDHDQKDFYRYPTPMWNIYLASGQLTLLASKEINQAFINIYSKIQYAEELEKEYVHARLIIPDQSSEDFSVKYVEAINAARKREANEIMEMIEELPKESSNARRSNTKKRSFFSY